MKITKAVIVCGILAILFYAAVITGLLQMLHGNIGAVIGTLICLFIAVVAAVAFVTRDRSKRRG